jgi:dipeptidyl aminopeptidase/acylaminoacyl peptidase
MLRFHLLLTVTLFLSLSRPAHGAQGKSADDKPTAGKLPGGAIAKLQPSRPLKNGRAVSVAIAPDGKTLAAAIVGRDDGAVCVWDLATGKELLRFGEFDDWVRTVAFSPDGKLLAAQTRNGIHLYDAVTGKPQKRIALEYFFITSFAFAPDGKTLAVGEGGFRKDDKPFQIRLFDIATGKERRRLGAHPTRIDTLYFSTDGKQIASSSTEGGSLDGGNETVIPGVSGIWDVATGKKLQHLKVGGRVTGLTSFERTAVVFAANMRRMAYQGEGFALHLRSIATGREFPLGEQTFATNALAFSGDNRLLASGHGGYPPPAEDGKTDPGSANVILWETLTARVLYHLPGYPLTVYSLAFSPNGKLLAAGNSDSTVLLWDVALLYRPTAATAKPDIDQLPKLWQALGDADPPAAHHAIEKMTSAPGLVVPWLSKQLKVVPIADPERLSKLIADLGNEQFALRQKASVELRNLKEAAEPALRDALERKLPLELHDRVKLLLDKLDSGITNADQMRESRAVLILERIASPEARALLETLSRGVPTARLTQEARDALARLPQ